MAKSFDQTFDTNVVQSLYILKNAQYLPQKVEELRKDMTKEEFWELYHRAQNIQTNKTMYITPQIMEEIKLCESKLPGIVSFTQKYFHIKAITSKQMARDIAELMEAYLIKEFSISKKLPTKQSALEPEKKDGQLSFADIQIVAENNVTYGNPIYTLNAKHMVSMPVAQRNDPKNPNLIYAESPKNNYRSKAIIHQNKKILKSGKVLHPASKANLKKPCATTYRVSDINKKKYYLESIVQEIDI